MKPYSYLAASLFFICIVAMSAQAIKFTVIDQYHDIVDHYVILDSYNENAYPETYYPAYNLTIMTGFAKNYHIQELTEKQLSKNINYIQTETTVCGKIDVSDTLKAANGTKLAASKTSYKCDGQDITCDYSKDNTCFKDAFMTRMITETVTEPTDLRLSTEKIGLILNQRSSDYLYYEPGQHRTLKISWNTGLNGYTFGSAGQWSINPTGWYNTTWNYKVSLNISNPYTDDLTNFPINLTVSTADASKFGDCSNIRIVYNSTTSLNWINTTSCGSPETVIWFRINLTALSNTTLYSLYYGSSVAVPSMQTNITAILGTVVKDSSLVGRYSMDENSNGTMLDTSGNNRNATTLAGAPKTVSGRFGLGRNCTGNDAMQFSNYANMGNVSASIWVFVQKGNPANEADYLGTQGASYYKFGLFQNNPTAIYVSMYSGAGQSYTSNLTLSLGRWYNVQVIRNYSISKGYYLIRTYIDGIDQTLGEGVDGTPTAIITGNSNIGVCTVSGTTDVKVNSSIDDIALYNKSLSLAEIRHNAYYYNITAIAGPESALTVLTRTSQTPNDINSLNTISTYASIIFNIEGYLTNTIQLYHKTNSTTNDYTQFVNGTPISGYINISYLSNTSTTFNFTLDDNDILPGTYNINEEYQENEPGTNISIGSNDHYKIRLDGIQTAQTYNFFEVSFLKTGTGLTSLYYCNSSYVSGAFATSSNCVIFGQINGNSVYNHTHAPGYSKHLVFSLPINSSKINGITVTSTSYFIVSGRVLNTEYLRVVPGNVSENTLQTSNNNGIAWSSVPGSIPDMHIHQFNVSDTLYYYVCANQSISPGTRDCSSVYPDILELGNLSPSSPTFITPNLPKYIQNSTILISYFGSISPNLYPISLYNISLLYSNLTFASTVKSNNSNNIEYSWNTTGTGIGDYTLSVYGCDTLNQCSSNAYSSQFNICYQSFYCSNYTACLPDDHGYCNEVTDAFNCSGSYVGNVTQFSNTTCDYCVPSWECSFYAPCNNSISKCLTVSDLLLCHQYTNLDSDLYNGSLSVYDQACDTTGIFFSNLPSGDSQNVVLAILVLVWVVFVIASYAINSFMLKIAAFILGIFLGVVLKPIDSFLFIFMVIINGGILMMFVFGGKNKL